LSAFNLSLFLLGCVGGLLPDILRLIRNRYKIQVPTYLRQTNFWIGVLLLVLIGGLTAWILGSDSPKEALIYGYASPQILSQLAAGATSERVERGEQRRVPFSLMRWWRM
jgi:hypothetical protein